MFSVKVLYIYKLSNNYVNTYIFNDLTLVPRSTVFILDQVRRYTMHVYVNSKYVFHIIIYKSQTMLLPLNNTKAMESPSSMILVTMSSVLNVSSP